MTRVLLNIIVGVFFLLVSCGLIYLVGHFFNPAENILFTIGLGTVMIMVGFIFVTIVLVIIKGFYECGAFCCDYFFKDKR